MSRTEIKIWPQHRHAHCARRRMPLITKYAILAVYNIHKLYILIIIHNILSVLNEHNNMPCTHNQRRSMVAYHDIFSGCDSAPSAWDILTLLLRIAFSLKLHDNINVLFCFVFINFSSSVFISAWHCDDGPYRTRRLCAQFFFFFLSYILSLRILF